MTMGKDLVLPLSYYGSKSNLADWILSYFPPHKGYLELFGGGASLLLLKTPVDLEVYNDKNRLLVNFFSVLRDEELSERLLRRLDLTPYSRDEFMRARTMVRVRTITDESSDSERLEMAWAVFVCLRQAFGGTFRSGWAYDTKPVSGAKRISRYLSAIDSLPHWVNRLRRVQLECGDWRDVASRYNYPDFLWYLDPPYVPETRVEGATDVYKEEMSYAEHEELVDFLIRQCQARVILSGYRHPVYRPLEDSGWQLRVRAVSTQWKTQSGVSASPREECLWISPNVSTEQMNLMEVTDYEE
ncbi:MAG: hypothetical protein KatS3mg087_1537 [Patescibacteria group bacterium]|nr:MAG: hypothetical protein KatS3mg087_1537 [Patescibacteria group bacterium]